MVNNVANVHMSDIYIYMYIHIASKLPIYGLIVCHVRQLHFKSHYEFM